MKARPGMRLLAGASDERLVALAHAGDEQAFAAIVERYRAPLLRYCRGFVLRRRGRGRVQQTFINAYAALSRDDDARVPAALRPWLYRIAHNAALNVARDPQAGIGRAPGGARRRRAARRGGRGARALPPRDRSGQRAAAQAAPGDRAARGRRRQPRADRDRPRHERRLDPPARPPRAPHRPRGRRGPAPRAAAAGAAVRLRRRRGAPGRRRRSGPGQGAVVVVAAGAAGGGAVAAKHDTAKPATAKSHVRPAAVRTPVPTPPAAAAAEPLRAAEGRPPAPRGAPAAAMGRARPSTARRVGVGLLRVRLVGVGFGFLGSGSSGSGSSGSFRAPVRTRRGPALQGQVPRALAPPAPSGSGSSGSGSGSSGSGSSGSGSSGSGPSGLGPPAPALRLLRLRLRPAPARPAPACPAPAPPAPVPPESGQGPVLRLRLLRAFRQGRLVGLRRLTRARARSSAPRGPARGPPGGRAAPTSGACLDLHHRVVEHQADRAARLDRAGDPGYPARRARGGPSRCGSAARAGPGRRAAPLATRATTREGRKCEFGPSRSLDSSSAATRVGPAARRGRAGEGATEGRVGRRRAR